MARTAGRHSANGCALLYPLRVGARQGLERLGALLALAFGFERVSGSFLGSTQRVDTALLWRWGLDDFCDSHQVFSLSRIRA